MASSWSSVGSGIIRVSEQNTQPKSHRLVTWTITERGAVAASVSARVGIACSGEVMPSGECHWPFVLAAWIPDGDLRYRQQGQACGA